MTETAALLSVLRERDIKLWVEHDQLKCSAPAGALDAEMRAALASPSTTARVTDLADG
jgi:hypothetical protein